MDSIADHVIAHLAAKNVIDRKWTMSDVIKWADGDKNMVDNVRKVLDKKANKQK